MTFRFRTLTFLLFLVVISGFLLLFSLNAYYTTSQILKEAARESLARSAEAVQHEFDIQLRLIDQDLHMLSVDLALEPNLLNKTRPELDEIVLGENRGKRQHRYAFALVYLLQESQCFLLKNPLLDIGPTNCKQLYSKYNDATRQEWNLLNNGSEWLLIKDYLITNADQKVVGRLVGGIKLSNNKLFLNQLVHRTQVVIDRARLLLDGVTLTDHVFEKPVDGANFGLRLLGLNHVLEENLQLPVKGFGEHLQLRLQSADTRIYSLASRLLALLVGGCLAGLVISALVAALLSSSLDKQLQKLVMYIRHLMTGAASDRWSPGRIDEFNRMGGQVDEIAAELSTRRMELKAANQKLEKALGDKRVILHQLINNQEQERNHLAQELHDELGQLLTAVRVETTLLEHQISMSSPALKNTKNIKDLVAAMYATVYDRIMALRPTELDHMGLCQSIQQIPTLKSLEQSGVTVSLDLEDVITPSGADIHLYRIVQEALTNVLKHALATELSISLLQTQDEVVLCIKDNGQGFVPDLDVDPTGHRGFGLLGIEERCDFIGAILTIESDNGVTMTVNLPC